MKIFFDTEFTGLHKNTTIISLGLVSEESDILYVEFNDYDESQCDDWIKENVIKLLYCNNNDREYDNYVYGDKKHTRKMILEFLNKFNTIEWISDVCHYDFVLLIDLLYGNALNINDNHSAVCHDINQDIAEYFFTTEKEAFDISREKIAELTGHNIPNDKHNALYDALIIREVYKVVKGGL